MHFDDVFGGLDSLWDAEEENAEWDERREIARADRSQHSTMDAIRASARLTSLSVGVLGLQHPIHLASIGANWVEGMLCGTYRSIVAPTHSIVWSAAGSRCECAQPQPRVVEYVTLTGRLRDFERSGSQVSVSVRGGGFRGRIVAVWKDGLDLQTPQQRYSVMLGSVELVTVDRA